MSAQPEESRHCAHCRKNVDADWQLVNGLYFCPGYACRTVYLRAHQEVKPVAEVPQVAEEVDFSDVLERMRKRDAALQARVQAAASQVPQTKLCERHQYARRIDFRESAIATRAGAANGIVYEHCPGCLLDARMQRDSGWLRKLGVPEIISHASFAGFTLRDDADRANLETAREYAARPRGFLFMLGDIGRGKSFLSAAVLREVGKGWFVTQAELITGLRRTYSDRRADDVVERAKDCRLLVLDDIGLSAEGRDVFPTIHEILVHRHGERSKPSVMNGNVDVPTLKELVGPRLADRLTESAFRVLRFAGPSMRAEKKGEYFA